LRRPIRFAEYDEKGHGMTLTLPLGGGCICGALRYRVNATPLVVLACHCRNCKQRTGSAFSLSMLTWRRDFELMSGVTIWRDLAGGSGEKHRQHVCPECLTRTHTEMLAYPEVMNVRPGTLDHPEAVSPIAQAWTSLAQSWALLPDVRCFEENPLDVEGLVGEWRALHE
jgi:hypothetical protein